MQCNAIDNTYITQRNDNFHFLREKWSNMVDNVTTNSLFRLYAYSTRNYTLWNNLILLCGCMYAIVRTLKVVNSKRMLILIVIWEMRNGSCICFESEGGKRGREEGRWTIVVVNFEHSVSNHEKYSYCRFISAIRRGHKNHCIRLLLLLFFLLYIIFFCFCFCFCCCNSKRSTNLYSNLQRSDAQNAYTNTDTETTSFFYLSIWHNFHGIGTFLVFVTIHRHPKTHSPKCMYILNVDIW